jgi:hypothetical protein
MKDSVMARRAQFVAFRPEGTLGYGNAMGIRAFIVPISFPEFG